LKSSKVKEREIEVEEEKMCFKFIFKERETAKRIKMSLGVNFIKVLESISSTFYEQLLDP